MHRHPPTENQAESPSRCSQSSSPDQGAGLPIRDGMAYRGLSRSSGSAPDSAQWPSLLEELDVRFLVLDIDHDAELLALFQARSEWVIDSRDEQVVLLSRTDVGPNLESRRESKPRCREAGGNELTDGHETRAEVQPMKPSQSAGFTTFCRACAHKERDERLRGPDYLAKVFHVGWPRVLLATSWITLPIARRKMPGLYEYLFARTEFFDELFRQALEENCPQIVLLGAGCDSRAYRFESIVKDTVIYELDHPATQQVKVELLQRGGITVPEYVRFVAADLNAGQLGDVLTSRGFRNDQRTLFLMEGVIYYLTAEGVDSLLGSIRDCSPPGSGLAFDYIVASMMTGTCNRYGAQQVGSRVASVGEVFTFGIDEHEIESFLEDRGFQLSRHLTSEDLEAAYLAREDGSAHAQIAGFYSIAYALTR